MLGRRSRQGDGAVLDDIGARRDLERLHDVLLDQQDRHALAVELADQREHLLDQQRRQAQRGLVEDQQARLGHHAAPDRQHLLLAARQRAGRLRHALAQPREGREDALEIAGAVGPGAAIAAELEVFPDIHVREDLAALRHVDQPGRDDRGGRRAGERPAVEAESCPRWRQHARQAPCSAWSCRRRWSRARRRSRRRRPSGRCRAAPRRRRSRRAGP